MSKAPTTRHVPRRRSSGKLLPLLALGELGKSDSFTLRAPTTQPMAAAAGPPQISGGRTTRPNWGRMRSCPNLGEDLNECGRSATELGMIPGFLSDIDLPSFDLADATAPLIDAATPMVDAAARGVEFLADVLSDADSVGGLKTEAEAEGMNLMSHVMLDFPAALARATVAAKAAEVAGRLFVLGQDLLPGHQVMPDELAFQVAFLAVSCNALYQTVMPKIKAAQACKFLTPGDRKAFRSLFKPAGLDWIQYREMSLHSMEWVDLEPGQALDCDDACWLYEGNVEFECEHSGSVTTATTGLLGEDHIAKTLGIFNGEDISSKVGVAGSEGAKVLKIDTQKLGQMMKNDQNLQAPLGRMLFNSMQNKIERVSRKNKGCPPLQRLNTR